ncbi:MAG: hypothetical protein KA436_05210 [Oligoflexales bacterium]|nr:hypothetical protein [Oligoflexales bacterium]
MKLSLREEEYDILIKKIQSQTQSPFGSHLGGVLHARQPIHTLYGGAQLWTFNSMAKVAALAQASFQGYGSSLGDLSALLDISGEDQIWLEKAILKTQEKLRKEPVEDVRVDFEDGYGLRSSEEEDADARRSALESVKAMEQGLLPTFFGIRVKALSLELARRSLRTLDIFVSTFLRASSGKLPDHFVVTLPKVESKEQVQVLLDALTALEKICKIPRGLIRCEFMVETPLAVLDRQGSNPLRAWVEMSQGRCRGLHIGTYDFTASCGVSAENQAMHHSLCILAKNLVQLSCFDLPVWFADGATTTLPVPPHKGAQLTKSQAEENKNLVQRAWKESFFNIQRSLSQGYYQGWDLHPAQIPIRYLATYYFLWKDLKNLVGRFQHFLNQKEQASRLGASFDDAATGRGLVNSLLRAYYCQAVSAEELQELGLKNLNVLSG